MQQPIISNYKNIRSLQDLISFLKTENNPSSKFILDRISRDPSTLKGEVHKHHILTLHSQGPDVSWNQISLTILEHSEVHRLLYIDYHRPYDNAAANMLRGNYEIGSSIIRAEVQAKMRSEGTGFYNSEFQRELGRRPKKQREDYARQEFVVETLVRGFELEHKQTKSVFSVSPNECNSLRKVINKLITMPEFDQFQELKDVREKWLTSTNLEKEYLTTALTRIITGHRDQKTNKALFSVKGWGCLRIYWNTVE